MYTNNRNLKNQFPKYKGSNILPVETAALLLPPVFTCV